MESFFNISQQELELSQQDQEQEQDEQVQPPLAPNNYSSICSGAAFHVHKDDPVLQYLDHFLMHDEQLQEQQHCMLQDYMRHHATTRGLIIQELSDILHPGGGGGPSNSQSLHGSYGYRSYGSSSSSSSSLLFEFEQQGSGMVEPPLVIEAADAALSTSIQPFKRISPCSQIPAASSSSTLSRSQTDLLTFVNIEDPSPPSITTSSSNYHHQHVVTSASASAKHDGLRMVISSIRSSSSSSSRRSESSSSSSEKTAAGSEPTFISSIWTSSLQSYPPLVTSILPSSSLTHSPHLWVVDDRNRNSFSTNQRWLQGTVAEETHAHIVSYVNNKYLEAEDDAMPLLHGLQIVMEGLRNGKLPLAPSLLPPPSNNGSKERRRSDGVAAITTDTDLKSLLLSCAQAVGMGNVRRANEILKEVRRDASPYGSDLQRLAHYFAEGLVARLTGTGGRLYAVLTENAPSAAKNLKAHRHYLERCPFVRTSLYFANSAIMKAADQASRLHIVDYGISYGWQWPQIISALAQRHGGPPHLRITGIDFPQPGENPSGQIQMTGHYLAEYAKAYHVPFEFQPITTEWEHVTASVLSLREDEVLVVNSTYRLRHLFDESVLPSNPRQTVLKNICDMNPTLFVQGVHNGNCNSPFFMPRFKETLSLYASKFDMLAAVMSSDSQERLMIEREVLGRDILNVVACEGPERVERSETYRQWQSQTQKAGLVQVPFEKTLIRDIPAIVKFKYNRNFSVDQDGCWMLLGWKGKVLNALSLWKPGHHT